MQLHPSVTEAIPHLVEGLRVSIGKYAGKVRADSVGQEIDGLTIRETGGVRLASKGPLSHPDGPRVDHIFTVRDDAPGIELDLFVSNGEVVGERTPHLEDEWLHIDAPPGMAIVSRHRWITVKHVEGSTYRVLLPAALLQGVLYTLNLALLPESEVENMGSVQAALDYLPWLTENGPGPVDGFPRWKGPLDVKVYREAAHFIRTGEGLDEADYLRWAYGGATGGMSIRFDFGAEFAALPAWMRYRLMHRWSHEIHSRPQRGYLTRYGVPLDVGNLPGGFNMSIGPTEFMFPNKSSNPYQFDEEFFAQAQVDEWFGVGERIKGSFDLQHMPRWFAPDAYLVQEFGCPIAEYRLRRMAAAARCDEPDPLKIGEGNLGRGPGWNAVVQATAAHCLDDEAARTWLAKFVAVCLNHQTPWGGLCAWTHNKEAKDYARKYLWELMPADERPESYEGLDVEPVTQSYQETILAWALWCAKRVGVGGSAVDERLKPLLSFIRDSQREPGHAGPCYRTTIDGARRSSNDSTFYHGGALALAAHLGRPDRNPLRDFTHGSEDPLAWLKALPDKRNLHQLIGVLEAQA